MNKFKPIVLVSLLVASALFSAGCTSSTNGEKLQLAGSTSIQPQAELLAKAFRANNTGVQVYVQGGGSSAGIQSVGAGTCDIGMSSRAVKASEMTKYPTLKPVVIAIDGIAIIVNPKNPVSNLTMNQTRDILTGNITNWSQVGGSNANINVVNREEGSGTRDGIQLIVLKGGNFSGGIVQSSTGAVRSTVAQDANAIGYISFAEVDNSVTALSINGVAPTYDAIADGVYEIQRDLYFVTKGDASGVASQFINYTTSPSGQAILKANGLVSITNKA